MKNGITLIFSAALVASLSVTAQAAEQQQITIGTGAEAGIYYAAGQSICRFVNRHSQNHGIQCTAQVSAGGVANVRSLGNGDLTLGMMQSGHQYKAREGQEPFTYKMEDLRALFSLHDEAFTILARRDAHIARFDDLKGRRVNIGSTGSGQRDTLEEIMALKGWSNTVFAQTSELDPLQQTSALHDSRIDAITYFVGHPNGAIQEAASLVDSVLIPLDGPDIDALLADRRYYTKVEIPEGMYKGSQTSTHTIGSKAVLSASANTDPELVYQVVKAVFDNLDRFKRLHPAFQQLEEQEMMGHGLSAPLHEGAVRYYRERGWM